MPNGVVCDDVIKNTVLQTLLDFTTASFRSRVNHWTLVKPEECESMESFLKKTVLRLLQGTTVLMIFLLILMGLKIKSF